MSIEDLLGEENLVKTGALVKVPADVITLLLERLEHSQEFMANPLRRRDGGDHLHPWHYRGGEVKEDPSGAALGIPQLKAEDPALFVSPYERGHTDKRSLLVEEPPRRVPGRCGTRNRHSALDPISAHLVLRKISSSFGPFLERNLRNKDILLLANKLKKDCSQRVRMEGVSLHL